MKIAIDTLFENPEHPTGSIDYLRNIAKDFPVIGAQHDFYFLLSKSGLRHFQEFERPNIHFVDYFRSNENMPLRIALQQSLVPLWMKKRKIELLFSPGNVCPLWGDFCRVLKINTLHQYHTPEHVGKVRTLYRKSLFEASARRADHILANTELTKAEICKFMKVDSCKVTVIAEALYDVYGPIPAAGRTAVREKYGLKRDFVLFVSILYPYKNAATAVKALAHLIKQKDSPLDLVIAGRDYEGAQAKLQSLANDLGIADRVRFLGFVPLEDLPALYSSAQVFVFPSMIETFGKPLVEAMQCGAPVVASNVSCIPEVLGGAGLLVNPTDAEEMALAIARVAENETLRADMKERGLKRAQNFSWESGAKETLAILENTHEKWKRTQVRSA